MKLHKIMVICLMLAAVWGLSACTAALSLPPLPESFSGNARHTFGEDAFNCTVAREDSTVTVTVTDTLAEGLLMACDGEEVTFCYDGMQRSAALDSIDVTNPARLWWEVLAEVYGGTAAPQQQDGLTVYGGTCAAGAFTLSQNSDGSWNTLKVPAAGITVIFA